jgi:S1-C subfamily serine protease
VSVLCDGKAVALGTVVRRDGYILTKASELTGKVTCKLGKRELPAEVVSQSKKHDLALLRVKADDLVPVEWAEGKEPPLGAWLVTPDAGGEPLGVGVLGHPSRRVAKTAALASKRVHTMNAISRLSGTGVSKRRDHFPAAFTHDTLLKAGQCGGPIVNLDGRAVGLNLARADRSTTYALAARTVKQVLADLLAGAKKS